MAVSFIGSLLRAYLGLGGRELYVTELSSVEGLENCLAESNTRPVFLFKHSTACPISFAAHDQVRKYLVKGNPGPEIFLIKVIESRPVSNAIAERLGVTHQSPQLILVKNGKAVWHASHHGITVDRIEEAVKQHAE